MPLSEEELRLLEQMERELAAEDPKFVATLQGRTLRRSARVRFVLAGAVFLGGVALLMGGVMAPHQWQVVLGALGFVVMLASATIGLAAWRGHRVGEDHARTSHSHGHGDGQPFRVIEGARAHRPHLPHRTHRPRSGTFMQRLEQRWNDRRNQGY